MYGFVLLTTVLASAAVFSVSAEDSPTVVIRVVDEKPEATETSAMPQPTPAAGAAETLAGRGTVAIGPTEEQAEEAFRSARQSFLAVAKGSADAPVVEDDTRPKTIEDAVAGGVKKNVSLEDIRMVLDVDNVTLREVMLRIVEQAGAYTGPWTVKWRLRPENRAIMDERVNLTAEANFGDFCSLLTERVKNMTGTQLFVTAFAGTRVLLVADTYY